LDKLLRLDRHIKVDTGGPTKGEERIFYIVQDPKTKLGRLVVADLDHLKIESNAWNNFRDVLAPIRKKFKLRDEPML